MRIALIDKKCSRQAATAAAPAPIRDGLNGYNEITETYTANISDISTLHNAKNRVLCLFTAVYIYCVSDRISACA